MLKIGAKVKVKEGYAAYYYQTIGHHSWIKDGSEVEINKLFPDQRIAYCTCGAFFVGIPYDLLLDCPEEGLE